MKPIHLIQVKQIITWILAILFQESFDWQQRSPAKSNRTPLGPYVSLHLTVQELSVGYGKWSVSYSVLLDSSWLLMFVSKDVVVETL